MDPFITIFYTVNSFLCCTNDIIFIISGNSNAIILSLNFGFTLFVQLQTFAIVYQCFRLLKYIINHHHPAVSGNVLERIQNVN